MTKKLRRVRINRAKWVNATNNDARNPSMMCNSNGMMCCLGFAMNQITRITKNKLLHHSNPSDVTERSTFLTYITDDCPNTSKCVKDNKFAEEAIKINDGINDDDLREDKLKKLFRHNGIILEFYGEYDDFS